MIYLNGEQATKKWLAGKLEHVIWSNDEKEIIRQVERSKEYGFRVVFSPNHHWHSLVHDLLNGTGIIMSTPINFPDGRMPCAAIGKQAEIAYKAGCRSVDMRPDMDAWEMRDWGKLTDSVRAVVDNFGDGEVKVMANCNGSLDDMYAMCDAIKAGGATHIKAYEQSSAACPLNRIELLRKKCDELNIGLKASGNGKYWTTAICMGVFAAGADYVSASNTFDIVDDLPYFESVYSHYHFE